MMMIQAPKLVEHIKSTMNGDPHVEVFDKTGMSDHFIVYVRSPEFSGKPLMARHRLVQAALKPLMDAGQLHAAEIKTDVPES
jgi:stress-induced morphogen